jgi:hypothetical protein
MRAMPRLPAAQGFDLIWSRGHVMADGHGAASPRRRFAPARMG